ncbi:MAG TPA: hypothetical protein PKV44_03690 [Bacillota bacterium]|nr:hypothetical protein [Bacillota bacterium]HPE38999.1 hypothetical protein [Bacillota bacterium]
MAETIDTGEERIITEVTEDVTDKKCPNCAATIVFDPATGGMFCEFCGYRAELPPADKEAAVCEMDFNEATARASYDWGAQKKIVVCKNCGGEGVYDALITSEICPFCGSTNVMPTTDSESMAPGGVVPFEIPKERTGELFQKWIKSKFFAPSDAKKNAKSDAFQGVYLPYWTYDAKTSSTFTGRAGFDKRVKRGDNYVTETTWRRVSGVYQEDIDDQTVVASKRNENSGVKQCEPFNFAKLVPYSPQIVAGFIAERYSIGLEEGWENAQKIIRDRLHSNIRSYIINRWHSDRADSIQFSTVYSNITYKYILVPIWISSFKYKEKVYQFVVNGQTGKIGGKYPISAIRVILTIIAVIAVIGLLYAFANS